MTRGKRDPLSLDERLVIATYGRLFGERAVETLTAEFTRLAKRRARRRILSACLAWAVLTVVALGSGYGFLLALIAVLDAVGGLA